MHVTCYSHEQVCGSTLSLADLAAYCCTRQREGKQPVFSSGELSVKCSVLWSCTQLVVEPLGPDFT